MTSRDAGELPTRKNGRERESQKETIIVQETVSIGQSKRRKGTENRTFIIQETKVRNRLKDDYHSRDSFIETIPEGKRD